MELKGRKAKERVGKLLAAPDFPAALDVLTAYPPRQSANYLISFFYDLDERLRWRAIAAFGRVVARLADENMESARVMMRRLMWNLNDESGGIGWGSPEAMGETMALHAGLAREFSRILRSYVRPDENFLEYAMLQQGVLWGIGRLAQIRPEALPETDCHLRPFLKSPDACHRGFAAWALGNLNSRDAVADLENLKDDPSEMLFFNDLALSIVSVGALAQMALLKIREDAPESRTSSIEH